MQTVSKVPHHKVCAHKIHSPYVSQQEAQKKTMMHTALPLFIPFCLLFLHFHHSTCSSTTTASDDDDNKPNNYTIDYSSPLWNNGTIEEIYDLLDCDDNIAEWDPDDVKIYDSHSWSILFETYKDIVEDDNDEEVKEWKWRDSGFQIPHVVLINQWGRGVYADADIPEGSLVYKCLNTICIDDPDDVRRLLKNVPSDLACEILHWAYIYEPKEDEELDENEEPYQNAFCLEFDDGALL